MKQPKRYVLHCKAAILPARDPRRCAGAAAANAHHRIRLARAQIACDHEHVRRLVFAIVVLTTSVADAATVTGIVVDNKTAEPLAGVTVVASSVETSTGEQVVITDEHGLYAVDVPPGTYTITLYYGSSTVVAERVLVVTGDISLGLTSITDTWTGCCVDWFDEHDPSLSSDPRFGLTMQRDFRLPTRDRTHLAWIAPAAAADPARVVTTVDGGARFAGAPGIPLAFVDDVRTY